MRMCSPQLRADGVRHKIRRKSFRASQCPLLHGPCGWSNLMPSQSSCQSGTSICSKVTSNRHESRGTPMLTSSIEPNGPYVKAEQSHASTSEAALAEICRMEEETILSTSMQGPVRAQKHTLDTRLSLSMGEEDEVVVRSRCAEHLPGEISQPHRHQHTHRDR